MSAQGRWAFGMMAALAVGSAAAELPPVVSSSVVSPSVVSPTLRRDEVRCDDEGCALGACVTAQLVKDPASLLPVRLVPNFQDGKPEGFRLFALRPDTLPTRLGLKNGDTLAVVNGQTLHGPDSLLQLSDSLRSATVIKLGLTRLGQPVTRRLVLDQSLSTPALAQSCPPLPTADSTATAHSGSDVTTATAAARSSSLPELLTEAKRAIRCTANRCTLRRSLLEKLLAEPTVWTHSARVIPMLIDGKPVGIKLLGIRPDSLFALLGLRNGDVVRSLAGQDLTTPEHALQAYSNLRNAKTIKVDLTRGQAPLSITYLFN